MVTHPVALRGPSPAVAGAPLLLQRTDDDFIGAVLGELGTPGGMETIARTVADVRGAGGRLKLFQPVQRTFHLALVEALCDIPGRPRVDPLSIESAGIVLRRLAVGADGRPSGEREGWRKAGETLRGWVAFAGEADEDRDPDPERRAAPATGIPALDLRLSLLQAAGAPLGESVAPLFPAPPEVCETAGLTLLYGLVPVASSEVSAAPGPDAGAALYASPQARSRLSAHLHRYLKAGGPYTVPRAGQVVRAEDGAAADMADFMLLLQQLAIELGAFNGGAEGERLRSVLNETTLSFPVEPRQRPAGDFLEDAVSVLLDRETAGASVRMPEAWPAVDGQQADRILAAVQSSLGHQVAAVRPQQGRFDDPSRLYVIRAFVRVRREDGCPPDLVWSPYSEPFLIAPWYESGDAPPVQVSLPDLTDRAVLRALKPNVAFAVPESLQNILNQNRPSDFLEGNGSRGSGNLGLDWICSFSIPIITLCAFIVLNIFLQLFDIIFRWMMFIKVCIPIPRRS